MCRRTDTLAGVAPLAVAGMKPLTSRRAAAEQSAPSRVRGLKLSDSRWPGCSPGSHPTGCVVETYNSKELGQTKVTSHPSRCVELKLEQLLRIPRSYGSHPSRCVIEPSG